MVAWDKICLKRKELLNSAIDLHMNWSLISAKKEAMSFQSFLKTSIPRLWLSISISILFVLTSVCLWATSKAVKLNLTKSLKSMSNLIIWSIGFSKLKHLSLSSSHWVLPLSMRILYSYLRNWSPVRNKFALTLVKIDIKSFATCEYSTLCPWMDIVQIFVKRKTGCFWRLAIPYVRQRVLY